MSNTTKIEWCNHTFSPWIGCTRVSAACDHCYAATLAERYGWAKFETGAPRKHTAPSTWQQVRRWNAKAAKAGQRASTFPSLCDPFDSEVDPAWLPEYMGLIDETPWLDHLLLTKRPQLAKKFFTGRKVPDNVMLGTTAENQAMADLRIPILLSIGAPRTFVSIEPMLGPIELRRTSLAADGLMTCREYLPEPDEDVIDSRIDWVIAGGESGPKARPSHPDWFRSLRDQCAATGVPFFFKQWGEYVPCEMAPRSTPLTVVAIDGEHLTGQAAVVGQPGDNNAEIIARVGKKAAGALLDGVAHREFPT